MVPEREKALDLALAQIERTHGKGAVMRLGDRTSLEVECIPTGSIALDIALGVRIQSRDRRDRGHGPAAGPIRREPDFPHISAGVKARNRDVCAVGAGEDTLDLHIKRVPARLCG